MKTKRPILLTGLLMYLFLCSCNPALHIAKQFYNQHEMILNTIEKEYKALYDQTPVAISFTDNTFNFISVEIITDTIKYIYEFGVEESKLNDTLKKYNIDYAAIHHLIDNMRNVKCIWINMLDYYILEEKNELVFIAIRPLGMNNPFTNKKYYILTFFNKQQFFDKEGNLLARNKHKRQREINGDIFRRINDKVCYTISDRFR